MPCTQRQRQAIVWQRQTERSKSEGKGKSKASKEYPKVPKVPKARTRVKTSETGLSCPDNSKSEASSQTQESALAYPIDNSHTDNSWYDDGWSCDKRNDEWSSARWHDGWDQYDDNSASSFSRGSFDLGAISSPKRFEWVKMNLDTGAAANTFPSTLVQMEQEMEDSIEQPVVSVSLMVELGSIKDTMKTVCSNFSMEESLVRTKC